MTMTAIALPDDGALSLTIPEGASFDDWQEIGRRLFARERVINWWIGDWWAFGQHRYGERAKMAAEGIFGRNFGTLMNLGSVARAFETSRRREVVPFTAYVEVASLPPEKADELIDRAAREGLTTRDLRRVVQSLKAAIDTNPVTTIPKRDPTPTRSLADAERDATDFAQAVVELSERWLAGHSFGERDDTLRKRARAFLADEFGDRRPVPDDFEVIFVEQGRLACEEWYRARRTTVDRWLVLSGKQTLLDRRAAYVEMRRTMKRKAEADAGRERTGAEVAVDDEARELAKAAAAFLRRPACGAWVVVPHGNEWLVGTSRRSTGDMIALAERKGFDAEAAMAEIRAEASGPIISDGA